MLVGIPSWLSYDLCLTLSSLVSNSRDGRRDDLRNRRKQPRNRITLCLQAFHKPYAGTGANRACHTRCTLASLHENRRKHPPNSSNRLREYYLTTGPALLY